MMKNYNTNTPVMRFEDVDLSGTYTYADYLNWEFNERLELIKGKIFAMTPAPGSVHQRISGRISFELYKYLQDKPCEVFTAPFDVRLPRRLKDDHEITTVLQPDLCVICNASKIDERGCIGAPDIVAEILSRGNNKKELKYKFEAYEEAGVSEYWIIHPEEKTFMKYILDENYRFQPSLLQTLGDEVTSPILPGFVMKLDDLFLDKHLR